MQVEDFIPSDMFSPATDGSSIEGKPRARRGLMAMKKNNLQVIFGHSQFLPRLLYNAKIFRISQIYTTMQTIFFGQVVDFLILLLLVKINFKKTKETSGIVSDPIS